MNYIKIFLLLKLFIFYWVFSTVTYAFLLQKNILKFSEFFFSKLEKQQYLPHFWSDKGFKGTIVKCESGVSVFARRDTWSYVNNPFKQNKSCKKCAVLRHWTCVNKYRNIDYKLKCPALPVEKKNFGRLYATYIYINECLVLLFRLNEETDVRNKYNATKLRCFERKYIRIWLWRKQKTQTAQFFKSTK